MKITILTLFPEYFTGPLQTSILKRAVEQQVVSFSIVNIRDFATNTHRVTDDRPYGGGAGMVLKIEPIFKALQSFDLLELSGDRAGIRKQNDGKYVVLTSAKGAQFTQETARSYKNYSELFIICGHYEGVDERVASYLVDAEVRVGDFVITGGEPAAAIMADAVTRIIPGVLGNQDSLQGESHDKPGVLGYPQFTRPETFNGWSVPKVVLSGNHAQIEKWRDEQRYSKDNQKKSTTQ